MALNNPRIIVVDENQDITHIVRAALDLMGRKPRLIETHTGEDALDEMHLRTPDLLITSQKVGSSMTGVMLALQAKREVAALPVIVVAAEDDHEMDDETLSDSPFEYLHRPLVPEMFIRALRVALDGPESMPVEAVPADMLGPVPQIDVDRLRAICSKLMRDVSAMSVILADRNGKVLTYDGAAGYIDRELMAAALGPTFAGVSKLLSIIGDQPRVLKYYDGDKFDIFSLAVGLHHFISLVFDGTAGNRALGNVKSFGGVAVNEMLNVIGEPAFKLQPMAAPEPAKAAEHKGRGKRRTTQEVAALKGVPAAKKPEPEPPAEIIPQAEAIPNFDPNIFDQLDSLDLSQADALFAPERMAAVAGPVGNGNRIGINDAREQGIIGSIDE